MIRFHALGVRFCLPLLTLLFPFLALRLGHGGSFGCIALALGAHELAHILAARFCGVTIREIRLTPFGGSARMENPYRFSSGRIIPVAAAGPAANLLLAVLFAALTHWDILAPHHAAQHIDANLVLCLFNLLPALPLDGGRILFALLRRPFGERHALRAGILLGRLLSLCLLGMTLAGGLRHGRWNLSFVLASVFIIASEPDERQALFISHAQRFNDLLQNGPDVQPLRILQANADTPLLDALHWMRPGEATWFLLSGNDRHCALLDGRSILHRVIQTDAPDAALGSLPAYSLAPERTSGAPLDD